MRESEVVHPQQGNDEAVQIPHMADNHQVHGHAPLAFLSQQAKWTSHDLGRMNIQCTGCRALHWTSEPSSKSPHNGQASYESCWKHGKELVEAMRPLPEPLHTLLNGDNARSRSFRLILRRWNELFAFTSIKFNMDKRMNEIGTTFQVFQVHGAMYHRQGPLVPAGGRDALYSQIYLYDPAYAAQERSRRASDLDPEIVGSLTMMLQESNPMI